LQVRTLKRDSAGPSDTGLILDTAYASLIRAAKRARAAVSGSLGKQRRESGQAEQQIGRRRAAGLVAVWVANATRTSAGPGPGVKWLPAAEAAALVGNRLALYGDQPPRGGHL
jgi:hypothetical protein